MKILALIIKAGSYTFIVLLAVILQLSCGHKEKKILVLPPDEWAVIKQNASPYVALPGEFNTPVIQPLSTMGWEDGIHISRDGLDLYCTYAPGDLFSWTLNSGDPTKFGPYRRGPLFGMDLVTNPVGTSSWIHSDILYAHRNYVTERFSSWVRTGISKPVFSEGAPFPLDKSGSVLGKFIYTCNNKPPGYDVDIWSVDNTGLNPSGTGTPLPNFPHTTQTEDNPHLERIDANTLVLMFDSDNYIGGKGSNDIWYSISADNGASWSVPANVSSINTSGKEHQPHLYKNSGGEWYLYYSAYHSDGKLGIFRAKQQSAGNWDSWGPGELVIGAGNTEGVGEPTLTGNGDISFVVIYKKTGNPYDMYDADPWFMQKK
jgi:hypothetical protein